MSGSSTLSNDSGNKTLCRFVHSLSILGCIILAFFIGTQYIANNTDHEATYLPFMGLVWAFEAMANGEDVSIYLSGLKISLIVSGVGLLLVKILFFIFRQNFKKAENPSDWSDTQDMIKTNMLKQDKGIYVGRWGDDYLRETSGEHVIVVGPTGSGKGTGYVIPNLLSWDESAIVFDMKGEIYKATSGYRKDVLKQKVFAIDLTCSDMVVERKEIEELQLDWKKFTEKIVTLNWGKVIDENTLVIKEDPTTISKRAWEVFNADEAFKIHALLQRPHRGTCAAFNPLNEIRMGWHETRDVQNIVENIINPQGEAVLDHWHRSARSLLTGLMLHTLYARNDKSLTGVVDLSSDPDRQMYEVLNSMLQTIHDPNGIHHWFDKSRMRFTKTHPVIARIAREMKDKQYEEFSGIQSTFMAYLNIFRDPIIQRNTSRSDFKISDIIEGKEPMTVYFIYQPSDKERLMPVLRLIFNQILTRMMENKNLIQYENLIKNAESIVNAILSIIPGMKKEEKDIKKEPKKRNGVLLVADEFTNLGRMDILKNTLSFMRAFDIRGLFLCQDIDQIYETYGKNSSILGQFKTRIYHATNSDTTAKQISADAGETIEIEESISRSNNGQESRNIRKVKTQMVSYDEAKKFPNTDAIIFRESQKPIYASKIVYYNDKWFYEMSKIPPVLISDVIPHEFEFEALTDVKEHKQLFMDGSQVQAFLKTKEEKRKLKKIEPAEVASHSVVLEAKDNL
ncbi:MAG: type IV secretory system conjugative DNA transfer family protein [Candidatus Omnitrophica bacterium]|nr:type IV secretory system conjugative DNA transfer family protein [Candidatus Omnitrophota bacterium]